MKLETSHDPQFDESGPSGSAEKTEALPKSVVGLMIWLSEKLRWPAELMGTLAPAFESVDKAHKAAVAHEHKINQAISAQLAVDISADKMTLLPVREACEEQITYLISAEQRIKTAGLIEFDIHKFKHYNDTDPTRVLGDIVITVIGEILRAWLRHNDMAFRYGGDEFFVILPDTENLHSTVIAAHHIESAIASYPWETRNIEFKMFPPRINIAALFLHLPTEAERQATPDYQRLSEKLKDQAVTALHLLLEVSKLDRKEGRVPLNPRVAYVGNGQLWARRSHRLLLDTIPKVQPLPR